MKTFQDFLSEGKNKKALARAIKAEKKSAKEQIKSHDPSKGPLIVDYAKNSEPGSIERMAGIIAMMDRDRKWREEMKRKQQQNDH